MREAKLLKVFNMGCPSKVPDIKDNDWWVWHVFVSEIATREFDHAITLTYWRKPGDPFEDPPRGLDDFEERSLYGLAYMVVDEEGNVLDSTSGYHFGNLKKDALEAANAGQIEDWSLETHLEMIPIAHLVRTLHSKIRDMKVAVGEAMNPYW